MDDKKILPLENNPQPKKQGRFQEPVANNGSRHGGSIHANAGYLRTWFVDAGGNYWWENNKGQFCTMSVDGMVGPKVPKLLRVSEPLTTNESDKDKHYLGMAHAAFGKKFGQYGQHAVVVEAQYSLQPNKEPRIDQEPRGQLGAYYTHTASDDKGRTRTLKTGPVFVPGKGPGIDAAIYADNGKGIHGGKSIGADVLATKNLVGGTAGASASQMHQNKSGRYVATSEDVNIAAYAGKHPEVRAAASVTSTVSRKPGDKPGISNYSQTTVGVEAWVAKKGLVNLSPNLHHDVDLTPLAERNGKPSNAIAGVHIRGIQGVLNTPSVAATVKGGYGTKRLYADADGKLTTTPKDSFFVEAGAVIGAKFVAPLIQGGVRRHWDERSKETANMNTHVRSHVIEEELTTQAHGAADYRSGTKNADTRAYWKDYEGHLFGIMRNYGNDDKYSKFLPQFQQMGVKDWTTGNKRPDIMAANVFFANPEMGKRLITDAAAGKGPYANEDYAKRPHMKVMKEVIERPENRWLMDVHKVSQARAVMGQMGVQPDYYMNLSLADKKKFVKSLDAVERSQDNSELSPARKSGKNVVAQQATTFEYVMNGVSHTHDIREIEHFENLVHAAAKKAGVKPEELTISNIRYVASTNLEKTVEAAAKDSNSGMHQVTDDVTEMDISAHGKTWHYKAEGSSHIDHFSPLLNLDVARQPHQEHKKPPEKHEHKPEKPAPVQPPKAATPAAPPKTPPCPPVVTPPPCPPVVTQPCPPVHQPPVCPPVHTPPVCPPAHVNPPSHGDSIQGHYPERGGLDPANLGGVHQSFTSQNSAKMQSLFQSNGMSAKQAAQVVNQILTHSPELQKEQSPKQLASLVQQLAQGNSV